MNATYERIEQLCANRNIDITTMCKDAGISRAIMSEYKMGRTKKLSTATLAKLSEYFDVTVDYILTGASTKKEAPAVRPAEAIRAYVESSLGRPANDDELAIVKAAADALIKQLREQSDK